MSFIPGLIMGGSRILGGLKETAPLYANYAMGAGMQGVGMGMQGLAGGMGAFGGTTFGDSFIKGAGATAGKGIITGIGNVLTGNGPIQRRKRQAAQQAARGGGCSCGQPAQPQLSCEQKCQYGRLMAQKCQGCKGKSPGKKCGSSYRPRRSTYSRPAGYGPYGSAPAAGAYRSGMKGRIAARQNARQNRRQTRVNNRQGRKNARQARRADRRANRRWRR